MSVKKLFNPDIVVKMMKRNLNLPESVYQINLYNAELWQESHLRPDFTILC